MFSDRGLYSDSIVYPNLLTKLQGYEQHVEKKNKSQSTGCSFIHRLAHRVITLSDTGRLHSRKVDLGFI